MAEVVKQIVSNGFVLFIPIFIWNLIFIKKLPPAFEDKTFDKNIPKVILIGESIFRTIIFLMPLTTEINYSTITKNSGTYIFASSVLVYFLSWIGLMYFPDGKWSKSLLGFCSPAITPIIWLIGFSLLVNRFKFDLNYTIWFYIVPSVIFVLFHCSHSVLAFGNSKHR